MFSPGTLFNHFRNMVIGDPMQFPPPGHPSTPGESGGMFEPSPTDIVIVRAMMVKALKLPADIVDIIFDHAEYWAHNSNYIDYMEEHKSCLRVSGGSKNENKFLIRSAPVGLTALNDRENLAETLAYDMNEAKPLPLNKELDPAVFKRLTNYPTPKLVHPVRKIVFSIKSKDQGWVGGANGAQRGTYNASWTWFEAGLERFDATQVCEPHCTADLRYNSPKSPAPSLPLCAIRPVQPSIEPVPDRQRTSQAEDEPEYRYAHPLGHQQDLEIQRNRLAQRKWEYNEVTWRWDDDIDPESEEAVEKLDKVGRGKGTGSGEFVRKLKLGDVISVWAKARFPAWVNNVENVRVDVYWAV